MLSMRPGQTTEYSLLYLNYLWPYQVRVRENKQQHDLEILKNRVFL